MTTTKEEMIERHIRARRVRDEHVLRAMEEVERTHFVPEDLREYSYADKPLPIGGEQTISQPYIVAYMVEALGVGPGDKVLEIGSGCGYNAAVLSRIADHVYSIEIIASLADLARSNLDAAGIENVTVRHGDGFGGWSEEAPFDAVMLTAAPSEIPEPLKQQLKIGGRLLAPVGAGSQQLMLIEKTGGDEYRERPLIPVRFVPMTGEADG